MSNLEHLGSDQERLLRHLCAFHILDYPSCLRVLDTEGSGDMVAMSYRFRPLTRYGYVKKDKDDVVSITAKGRDEMWTHDPLIASGGGEANRKRVLQVSRMAALLDSVGVYSCGQVMEEVKEPYFIPSACWRRLAPGILSTTRFLGMLMLKGRKLAIYHIGDGRMEWQIRAESSLFYCRYGSFETKADGMILVCNEDGRLHIAENIIRQTMWARRQLLSDSYTERHRPTRWSRSPIKLRTQYEHVYLTTPHRLKEDLRYIAAEGGYIQTAIERQNGSRLREPKDGDFEVWPQRYFVNPASDLLKFVYFFSAVKEFGPDTPLRFVTYIRPQDEPIIEMYPELRKEVDVGVYRPQQNAGQDPA